MALESVITFLIPKTAGQNSFEKAVSNLSVLRKDMAVHSAENRGQSGGDAKERKVKTSGDQRREGGGNRRYS